VKISGSGNFTMSGGTIGGIGSGEGNTAAASGGGVCISGGDFTMSGGTILGNIATGNVGGGVYFGSIGCTFTLEGGEIGGNSAVTYGGGVYVSTTFVMKGGTIYGSATSSPTPPADKENTATTYAALYKSASGLAYWGEGTTGYIAGVTTGPTIDDTTFIVGDGSTAAGVDGTLTATAP
jgi:hypothetical protein